MIFSLSCNIHIMTLFFVSWTQEEDFYFNVTLKSYNQIYFQAERVGHGKSTIHQRNDSGIREMPSNGEDKNRVFR